MHYEKKPGSNPKETFVHVSVDSKAGATETDFTLLLETTGNSGDPGSVRRLTFNGKGWPKGAMKGAVLDQVKQDPDATPQEIADRVGCSVRYVQKLLKGVKGDVLES
jgi:hypothetical protein